MPAEKGNKKTLSFWLDNDSAIKIKQIVEKSDISRSKIVGNIIEIYTKELWFYHKLGFIPLVIVIRNIAEKIKKPKTEPKEQGGQAITIWIDKDVYSRIEKIAEMAGLKISKLVNNQIRLALSEFKILEKFGVAHHSQIFKDLGENAKNRFKAAIEKEGFEQKIK